ncbi:hypothetical protein E2C01_100497 [Portunus trituberculatus]|uniref:Uncharacterized protein n=1 Tax=Portunus trituberculatus TaxID=210409 RepID=A0A5B7KI41_PORTR|nr:hypothetical protein [Portunus trituberculatus]
MKIPTCVLPSAVRPHPNDRRAGRGHEETAEDPALLPA